MYVKIMYVIMSQDYMILQSHATCNHQVPLLIDNMQQYVKYDNSLKYRDNYKAHCDVEKAQHIFSFATQSQSSYDEEPRQNSHNVSSWRDREEFSDGEQIIYAKVIKSDADLQSESVGQSQHTLNSNWSATTA